MNSAEARIGKLWKKPWLPYVLPFALFLLLTEPARFFPSLAPFLYITKTLFVGSLLWFWRKKYVDDFSSKLSGVEIVTAVSCGLLVLILWIVSEGLFYQMEQKTLFNPYGLGESQTAFLTLVTIRLQGAALVVPIMEELFWRSFFMRYLIDPDFKNVPMGAFSWLSFSGMAILFGLEHNRIVVGILAGIVYGFLLIHQKKLKGVIVAHTVTNLGLGIYVLLTDSWCFW